MPDVTNVFGLEPEKLKIGMLTVTKRVLDIADVDIEEMSAELMEISPMAYVIYYEECIHAIQDRVRTLKDGDAE